MSNYERANRLYRVKDQAVICGICAGVADFFCLEVLWVRILTIVMLIISPPFTLITYIVLRLLLSPKPAYYELDKKADVFYRDIRCSPATTIADIRYSFNNLDKRLQTIEMHLSSREHSFHQAKNH